MADNPFIPASPQNVSIRPLDKGVVNNLSPAMVPKGGFLELTNWRVGTDGLSRRPVWIRESTVENFVEFPPIQNMWEFWDTSGVKRTVFADGKFLYKITANSQGEISTAKLATTNEAGTSGDTNSIAVTAGDLTKVNGTNTAFTTNDIRVGDVLYCGATTAGKRIRQIVDNTTLYVATSDTFTAAISGETYYIQEGFYDTDLVEVVINGTTTSIGAVPYLDATQTGGEIVFSDGYRPPKNYDGTSLSDFSTSPMVPVCVAYFRDRVFAGQIMSASSGYGRQRIRWSEAGDVQLSSFPVENYVDLPYQMGALWRLVPFAQALAAFFDDAIYIGRPTSSSSMPVYFEKVETGGVGLVAMRGVTSWMDALFFVGKDNVYMITAQEVRPIGTPAVRKHLQRLDQSAKFAIMGYSDTVQDKIGFAMPEVNGTDLTGAWEMDIETGAWSWIEFGGKSIGFIKEGALAIAVTFDGFGSVAVTSADLTQVNGTNTTFTLASTGDEFYLYGDTIGHTIASITDGDTLNVSTTDAFTQAVTGYGYEIKAATDGSTVVTGGAIDSYGGRIDNYTSAIGERRLYLGIGGGDNFLSFASKTPGDTLDFANQPPEGRILTGDIDLDGPDEKKLWNRLAVKLTEQTPETGGDIQMRVRGSVDRGQNWKELGFLTIAAGTDEGKVNFRLVGSQIRFLITLSTNPVGEVTITEMTLRVKSRGQERRFE